MAEGRFGWYEKVRVNSADPGKASIAGKLGAVLGKTQSDDGRWSYGVFIYETGIVWSCFEEELSATGKFDRRESFYTGESVRVGPDGQVGGSNNSQE